PGQVPRLPPRRDGDGGGDRRAADHGGHLLSGGGGAARRRVPGPLVPGRGLRRLRALPLGADRQSAGGRRRHLRRPPLLLDRHLERGRRERGHPPSPGAVLALRPLLPLRAGGDRHPGRVLPRPLHRRVSRLHLLHARRTPLAGDPVMRGSRALRSWSQLVLQVAFLLLALGPLQLVAERTNRRFDLTPGRSLSLSSVTRKLLAQVTVPLKVTVFFRRGTREQYADLLERFRAANPHVAFELYDLDRFPERGRSLGVEQYGRAAI